MENKNIDDSSHMTLLETRTKEHISDIKTKIYSNRVILEPE